MPLLEGPCQVAGVAAAVQALAPPPFEVSRVEASHTEPAPLKGGLEHRSCLGRWVWWTQGTGMSRAQVPGRRGKCPSVRGVVSEQEARD